MGQSTSSLLDPTLETQNPGRATHHHHDRNSSSRSTRSTRSNSKHETAGARLKSPTQPGNPTNQPDGPRRHRSKGSKPLKNINGNARHDLASAQVSDQKNRDPDTKRKKPKGDGKPPRPHRHGDHKTEASHNESTRKIGKPHSHTKAQPMPGSSKKHSKANTRSRVHERIPETKTPPQAKRAEKKDCLVCAETLPIGRFPTRVPTSQCTHDINTCRHCLRGWLRSEFTSKVWNQLDCPECRARMAYEDVKEFAPPEVFRRYDRFSMHAALEAMPGFEWCIAKGCKSGQILDGGNVSPRFRCVACRASHCVVHQIPWHRKETCAQYDYRTDTKIKKAEESASRKLIKELAKKCPGCKWNIEKNDGCDHMTCSRCRHQFCWLCLAPWDPIRNQGAQMHRPTCGLHSDGTDVMAFL